MNRWSLEEKGLFHWPVLKKRWSFDGNITIMRIIKNTLLKYNFIDDLNVFQFGERVVHKFVPSLYLFGIRPINIK